MSAVAELDCQLKARIRSSFCVNAINQCVSELVLNSLDARSTSISVRVNLKTFRVQVVDNGKGITRKDLELVGNRYVTNKCHTLEDLQKKLKFYGFRGEALASISDVSEKLTIMSRHELTLNTYSKIFQNNETQINEVSFRPSIGTTVTVEGFLSKLPVRQNCMKSNQELDTIKRFIESLIIIQPKISFSLRDDSTWKILIENERCEDVLTTFHKLHPHFPTDGHKLLRVEKSKVHVSGLLFRKLHDTKKLQYFYVNKRPTVCGQIQISIQNQMKCLQSEHTDPRAKHPAYVIHVKCPNSYVDLILEPAKTNVNFKKHDLVESCIKKMIDIFLGVENKQDRIQEVDIEAGVSQVFGAVKGSGRKANDDKENYQIHDSNLHFDFSIEKKLSSQSTPKLISVGIQTSPSRHSEDIFLSNPSFTGKSHSSKVATPKMRYNEHFPESTNVAPKESPFFSQESQSKRSKPVFLEENNLCNDPLIFNTEQVDDINYIPENNPGSSNVANMTLFTYNPENEEKGRNLVMNMFMKSVQVFPKTKSETTIQPSRQKGSSTFNLVQSPPPFAKPNIHTSTPKKSATKSNSNSKNSRQNLGESQNDFRMDFNPNNCIETNQMEMESIAESPQMIIQKTRKQTENVKKSGSLFESPFFVKPAKPSLFDLERKRKPENFDFHPFNALDLSIVGVTRRKKSKDILDDSVASKFFQNLDQSEDLFAYETKQSQIIVSLNDGDKEKILKKDADHDKNLNPISQNDLWRREDVFTGEEVITPSKDLEFTMKKRFDFMPKGTSPILKEVEVEPISPSTKRQFENKVVDSFQDELLSIKWKNYLESAEDPNKFFQEIYAEKSKLIEADIPNAFTKINTEMNFTPELFSTLLVIGQVDYKFIAAVNKTNRLLLLFDQHAVDERIRLERLLHEYKQNVFTKIPNRLTIFLPQDDLQLIEEQTTTLNALGLYFDYFTNGISIFKVPACLYHKSHKSKMNLHDLVEVLVKELMDMIKSNGINCLPNILQNIISSEACTGAIKFGDYLMKEECSTLLEKLSKCDVPFQCAHGRPTLTPLMFLNEYKNPHVKKLNFHKLRLI